MSSSLPNPVLRTNTYGGPVLCSGIIRMSIPEGGPHVRQGVIDLPVQFNGRPTVTAVGQPVDGLFECDYVVIGKALNKAGATESP
jgi:hypothetical protein